nr:NAD(P)-dependent oxidoreductase [Klebsiella pneumoniae]
MAAHTNVCVIGLGSMGMGAARACLQAGLNTWGVDINPDNCRALLAAGAKGAGPSAVPFAAELDAVVLLVVNAAQVRGILFGESGLAAHLKPGTVVMVSSTIASADAQAIAEALAEYQLLMLDAPVSGGAVKAAAGDMTVMASGSDAAFARLAPVLDAVAGKVYRIGSDIGLGSTVKIIHQLLAGVHIAVAAIDAPVSGGAVKAAAGDMTVMASGSDAAFARLAPVLDAVAGKAYRIGSDIGLGSTVKIIHQLLAGVHIAVAAEAMALAARAGIPLETMYDVVTHAAGNSWMFENRMQHVLDGDYSPKSAVDIFVKDLGLVNDTARALTFPLPLATTALNMFTSASNAGFGREDDSAVIKIFNGITLPGHKQ